MPAKKPAAKKTPKAPAKKKVTPAVETPVSSTSSRTTARPDFKKTFLTNVKKPQIFVPVAVLLAVIVVFLLKSWIVVAMVNGQFISRSAFESAMEKQAGKQTLNSLVTQTLVEQEAAKKGISVPQSDINSQEKKIDQQLAAQGQTLDQALQARGMSKADLEEQLKLQTLLQKLLANQITVSDKDIQDYIDKNKDSLPTGQTDAELKASVKQQLEQQKLSTAAQDLVQKLQTQAHITYFVSL